MKKIITHAGTHHADELLAIATIHHFVGELAIERTYSPTNQDFEDPNILVLDIGMKLDSENGNFDHHQNGEIPATNVLVLDHFCKDEKLKHLLLEYLFSYVDAVDRGIIIEGKDVEFHTPSFNSIIRNLNSLENGFEIALELAKTTLKSTIETAKKAIESEQTWSQLEKIGKIAIHHDKNYIVGWKEMAEKEGILALLSPNIRVEGSYQIISRDTEILKIPEHEKQTFLHANKFIASYPDFSSALNHAEEFLLQKNVKPQVLKSTTPFFEDHTIEIEGEIESADIYYPVKIEGKIMIAHFQGSGINEIDTMIAYEEFQLRYDGEEIDFDAFVSNELVHGTACWENID